ncbi:putative transcriptional regulator, CadC [Pectobacterium parmentieri WPP163]|uniref:winged helix-turn-helix domain-containing protein n=1 Tax=Pectobacterium parmentieri TaxID=1905730 RepID=UPI0001BA0D81|nr:winged helix-turn-helix domain-containing protein [Pectobacterium parmentieri]ACX86877.1 putative transcriptional regulator, CadC [Pectobacterium parmentieri WPP163]AYH04813.1 CadC family transcriptional regulator [Pectobacterium parmentieri]AYH13633.1 CadC family transcriptional regulator [Pectobacterium parmentieri]AYH22335.1 CadC family transcriptional regulator [Pectobacterium parmentieri]MBI0558816.1 CadC family transcriptional regulator [Pectobacterium parmentieri]
MVYLINDLIIFNEGEGTLAWVGRESEAISVNFPISRLLCLLIENQGITLSRDFLLEEALEKHALCPSINNLNNYLSLLRKVLREFDIADSIVTIPKIGIVFNVESRVFPSKENREVEGENNLNQCVERGVEPKDYEGENSFSIEHHAMPEPVKKQQYIKYLILWTVVVGAILLTLANVNRFPYRQVVNVSMNGKCDLFYLYDSVSHSLPTGYEHLCSGNTLFFNSKKTVMSGTLDKKSEIAISCKKDGGNCVTYVNN